MCADDLDLMPTVGDGAYSDEEVHWCKETIRYLRSQLDNQGLIDRHLPGARVAVHVSARKAAAANAVAVTKSPALVPATMPSRNRRPRSLRRRRRENASARMRFATAFSRRRRRVFATASCIRPR